MVSHIRRKLPLRGMAIKGPRRYAAYLNISRFASRGALTKDAPGGPCVLSDDLSIFVLFYGNYIGRCQLLRSHASYGFVSCEVVSSEIFEDCHLLSLFQFFHWRINGF